MRTNDPGMVEDRGCEEDYSCDCVHVTYAWTVPKVREIYQNAVKEGKVNGK